MLCFVAMLIPSLALADNITFEGSAPSVVRLGERFQLTYSLNASGSDMRMSETSDFNILMGPSESTSRSVSIINGKMSQSVSTTYTFILKAIKEGQFTIPVAHVTADGKQIQSNAITIKVVEASANTNQNSGQDALGSAPQSTNSNNADIVITQSLSRNSVYEGEPVVLTTKIYTRANLQQISDIKQPDLTNFVSSDISGNGQLQFQQEVRNGVIYQAAVAGKQLLIPQKSGKITINPIEYEFVVKERSRNTMGGGFFGGFFDDVQLVKRRVASNNLALNVKPLPQTNAKTSGGVGNFKFNVTVEPTDVKVDNSVLIKVNVSGEGNLKLLTMPKPRIHSDFDTFDPNENVNVESTANGYKGTRSAEYLVIPRREGNFEIPEISFIYFDPQQGKYITRTQGPFTIHVAKGDGQQQDSNNQVSFSSNSREQVQYVGKDIRYVHTDTKIDIRNTFFLFSPLFFMSLILPLGIFAVVFIIFRKKAADAMNVSGVKRRRANKAAMKRLKTASRYMKEQKREAFFDEVMRALWGYLSDKLTLPLSVLTKDNAKEEMQKHNITADAADAFMQLLDTCEFARYAPVEMAQPMNTVFEQAENVIGQIEEQIKN